MKTTDGDSVFAPLTRQERLWLNSQCLGYVRKRDGYVNAERRTLSEREARRRERERHFVVCSDLATAAQIDAYHEARQGPYSRAALKKFDALVLWMIIITGINRDESYAVDLALRDRTWSNPNDPMTYIELEELYHSGNLEGILKVLGVQAELMQPHGFMKGFLYIAAKALRFFSHTLAIVGEIVGTLIFVQLRSMALELFDTKRDGAKRILSLLDEILIDEVGHVAYVRTQLGPVRAWIAQHILLPILAPRILASHPAIGLLFDTAAIERQALDMRWDYIPPEIRRQAFTFIGRDSDPPATSEAGVG